MRIRNPLSLLTRAVPRLHLTPGNTCLLLQDLHCPFADPVEGWLAVRARDKVLLREFDEYYDALDLVTPNIARIVARLRQLDFPILYSCLGYSPPAEPSPFQKAVGWCWNLSTSDGAFPSAWQPEPGDALFAKPGWGALANPELAAHLHQQGIHNVILLGAMFEFGIRQSCAELTDRGYQVLVVSDAVIACTQVGRTTTTGSIAHGMTKLRSTGELMDLLNEWEREGQESGLDI